MLTSCMTRSDFLLSLVMVLTWVRWSAELGGLTETAAGTKKSTGTQGGGTDTGEGMVPSALGTATSANDAGWEFRRCLICTDGGKEGRGVFVAAVGLRGGEGVSGEKGILRGVSPEKPMGA